MPLNQPATLDATQKRPRQSLPACPTWLLALALAAITVLAYSVCFHAGFIEFDDTTYVSTNPHVRDGLTAANISWAFSAAPLRMGSWGPLTWLSHMADCQFYGLNPSGHHATSILLHALNALLLFLLLFRATGYRWRSLLVASIFALHPLNVENVAWIAERKSVLCMTFSLCTAGAYGWYCRHPGWQRYLAVLAAFVGALLCKPMAVTLPLLLLLLDYWPLHRLAAEDGRARWLPWLEKLPMVLLSAAAAGLAVLSQTRSQALDSSVAFSERLRNTLVSYVIYLGKLIWPHDLCYFYPFRGGAYSWTQAFAALFFLLAVTAFVAYYARRRHLVFAWAAYLISLMPVIGLLKLGGIIRADRYLYLPMIGLLIAAVWEGDNCCERLHCTRRFRASLALLLAATLALSTYVNASYWRDSLTLFLHGHQVAAQPDATLETNLAGALGDAGRLDEALAIYRNAAALAPHDFYTRYNVGYTYGRLGNFPAALIEFQESLRLARTPSQQARAYDALGRASMEINDRTRALAAFSRLLELTPDDARTRALVEQLRPPLHRAPGTTH